MVSPGNMTHSSQQVAYCIAHDIDFLAQSGGHGWATTFSLGRRGVIIDLRGLNNVKINKVGDAVTFGGGALISEVVDAAYKREVEVRESDVTPLRFHNH